MDPPAGAGVNAPLGWNDDRLTEDSPRSARFVPEDDRWNIGWFGRDMARDCLDPDIDLPWLPALAFEFDRFMADGGGGIPVFVLMPPRV